MSYLGEEEVITVKSRNVRGHFWLKEVRLVADHRCRVRVTVDSRVVIHDMPVEAMELRVIDHDIEVREGMFLATDPTGIELLTTIRRCVHTDAVGEMKESLTCPTR